MFNKNASFLLNQSSYITSETYYALNRNTSEKYIVRSTSTLFYDLDTIAKRHSYHFVSEYPSSDSKIEKKLNEISNKNGFSAKSEAIVQECATQIRPKLTKQDSLKISSKRMKKRSFNGSILSSEMFLRDNDYTNRVSDSFVKKKNDLRQKIWSYAKYRTEYTNPLADVKKYRKKDRGKRMENPCPCQLFSYACPCTDKKSLTELAKNSKSLTVADQITSTTKFLSEEDRSQNYIKVKKSKCSSCSEDKPTNTNVTVFANKRYEMTAVYEEPVTHQRDIPQIIDEKRQSCSSCIKNSVNVENKSRKRSKLITCPNCKEKIEIFNTDDVEVLKINTCPHNHSIESSSPTDNLSYKINNVEETDVCIHDPPCELVPVCQILPTDNKNYVTSPKCVRRVSLTKHSPKVIRITKACRHHPPCTVVPSCQRLNVLKNNCEYIPPCLHRPRCVNVPLCVPHSKSLHYDDVLKKTDDIDFECTHYPPCKITSSYQQESLSYANQTCEYFSEYCPRFTGSQMPRTNTLPTFSPCHETNRLPCKCCKSNKSCQYDCVDCKCVPSSGVKGSGSSDEIIYIRDVGCQFRSENFAPRDSMLHSKTFSSSFDLTNAKAGTYYSNYRTLRYEDKCTNPISGDVSLSTFTTSSMENNTHCSSRKIQDCRKRTTGFSPQSMTSPFVTAFSTYRDPILHYLPILSDATTKSDSIDTLAYLATISSKSQRSFIKGKHKKVFTIRRRKKTKRNNTIKTMNTNHFKTNII